MKYLLTIYGDQDGMENLPSDQGRAITQSYATSARRARAPV